jgi:hypothetical protein
MNWMRQAEAGLFWLWRQRGRMAGMRSAWVRSVFAVGLALTVVVLAAAQEKPAGGDDLPIEQARLADRFERLEQVVGRLAELSASTDPRRARLLRETIAQSRDQDINVRFESIVNLLEEERLSAAANNQSELQKELDSLLSLLLKAHRDDQLKSERERIRSYLKEVGRLIRMQQGIRARTEGGEKTGSLAQDQQQVSNDTGRLNSTIEENERDEPPDNEHGDDAQSARDGNPTSDDEKASRPSDPSQPGDSSADQESAPSEGQPSDGHPSGSNDSLPSDSGQSPGQEGSPSQSPGDFQEGGQSGGQPAAQQQPTDRATERLRTAQQRMEEARKKLDETAREGAADNQREAVKELELAKAELERVLRQIREEEMEQTLTQLAARFRKMLEAQLAVYEGTKLLDRVPEVNRDHDDEIEAARLGRQESLIVREIDKAMLLLREEGSSVAFPEAVEQIRDDMQQVVERLAAMKVGTITQGLEEDIIAALEETIAALEKAIKDLDENRTPPGQTPAAGQMTEPPLVDKLAELKMIRSLQMRINRRTERYGEMLSGKQAETPELLEALRNLAERQQRIYQATYDLNRGSND